jgi:drug/metabolite transporter (DMT)-like permease
MPAITQKALAAGAGVGTILAVRYSLGVCLVWLYILARRQNFRVGAGNAAFMAAAGFITIILATLMNESYKHLPGFVASVISFMYVVIVVCVEIAIGKEKPYKYRMFCLALVVLGMAGIVWSPGGGSGTSLVGVALAAGTAVMYSAYAMVMGMKKLAPFSAEVVMGYMFLAPLAASVARALAAGEPMFPEGAEQTAYTLLVGLTAGFIAPVAFCQAIKTIGASTAALINTSEPVIAYFAGALIMRDQVPWSATLGGLAILAAILALNIFERRRNAGEGT